MNFKYYFAGVLSVTVIVGIVVGGYFLGRSGSSKTTPRPIPTPSSLLESPRTIDTTSAPSPAPEEITKLIVSTAVSAKDYSALESFMVDPVAVRIEASGCCQPMSPKEASVQLEYLNSANGTWDFEGDGDVVSNLQASYPEHYANAIVGVSSDNYVVAFQLNADGKISKISMAVDYELLLPWDSSKT